MAFNPSPKVARARDFANEHGADQVIILYVLPSGQVGYASYGKTKALCDDAKRLADLGFDAINGKVYVRRRKEGA